MQPSRKAKNSKSQNFYSPVDPTIFISSVGSTGDNKKKPSPSRTGVSQPATFGKLDDWRIKTSPKGLKFCRNDHKDLVNIPTKGIDESLHGLGGIVEFPSKNGVFLEHEKLRFEKTRDSVGFSTRLGGLESLQRITQSSQTRAPRINKANSKFIAKKARYI